MWRSCPVNNGGAASLITGSGGSCGSEVKFALADDWRLKLAYDWIPKLPIGCLVAFLVPGSLSQTGYGLICDDWFQTWALVGHGPTGHTWTPGLRPWGNVACSGLFESGSSTPQKLTSSGLFASVQKALA